MFPAGEPVTVMVRAPPPAGPNAPGFFCWQSGHVPLPSVHCAAEVHTLGTWSQEPVPEPVQQLNGTPAAVHVVLSGQPFAALSPSKQPVPAAVMSRQNPQNTLV